MFLSCGFQQKDALITLLADFLICMPDPMPVSFPNLWNLLSSLAFRSFVTRFQSDYSMQAQVNKYLVY